MGLVEELHPDDISKGAKMEQREKTRNSNWLIYVLIVLVAPLIIRTLKMNFSQIHANLNSGYGLTDEGFAINALRERTTNGFSSHSFTFSEPLVGLFWIAGENIFLYRLAGLIILVAIVILFLSNNITKSLNQNVLLLLMSTYFLVSILTIPSVFRYLLVTPTYQWTLLVCSTILNVLLLGRQPSTRHFRILLNISLTFLIFAMTLSRPTSGGIALISVLFYLLSFESWKSKSAIYIAFSQVTLLSIVFVFDISNLRSRFLEIVSASQAGDPNGYSLISEIADVVSGILILGLISIVVFFLTRHLLISTDTDSNKSLYRDSRKLILAFTATLILILLSVSELTNLFRSQKYILIVSVVTAILAATFIKVREYFGMFVISFLPFSSQFGSNTPALGNVQILLLCQSLLLIGVTNRAFFIDREGIEDRKIAHNFIQIRMLLFATALIFSLIMFNSLAKSQVGNNYHKTLYPTAAAKSTVNGLHYTFEKLQSLDKFAKEANLDRDEEIIDLSSFHPGLIVYAGGITAQRWIPDKHFIYRIREQLRFVMILHGKSLNQQGTNILVETNLKTIPRQCTELSSLMAVKEISIELKNQGFDPKVRYKGLYSSFPEDLTLYPNNALLVETCGN
jgi:hypothetical protein